MNIKLIADLVIDGLKNIYVYVYFFLSTQPSSKQTIFFWVWKPKECPIFSNLYTRHCQTVSYVVIYLGKKCAKIVCFVSAKTYGPTRRTFWFSFKVQE